MPRFSLVAKNFTDQLGKVTMFSDLHQVVPSCRGSAGRGFPHIPEGSSVSPLLSHRSRVELAKWYWMGRGPGGKESRVIASWAGEPAGGVWPCEGDSVITV